jgi:hypothetical protein
VADTAGFVFDENFVEAFAHREHRVLGFRLRPYSFWHRMQLEYSGSPFATGGSVTRAHLENAVAICRTQFGSFARPLPFRWARRPFWNIQREVEKFTAYVKDYTTTPRIEADTSSGMVECREPDVDQILVEVAAYRRNTGCPRGEPWNLPMAEVYWMNACFARSEGAKFEILTPLAEERRKRLREKQRELDEAEIQRMINEEGLSREVAEQKLAAMYEAARTRREALRRASRKLLKG